MSMSLIWVYILQKIIRLSGSLYLYFILLFLYVYDILFQISCSSSYMIFCDFVCIMQLFSYSVIQFYIHSELMIDLKFRLIKVTKLKIDMWITLHVIFQTTHPLHDSCHSVICIS